MTFQFLFSSFQFIFLKCLSCFGPGLLLRFIRASDVDPSVRTRLHRVFFSSYPLLRLTRIDLVHQEVPFLANHLLALGAWLSNDLPNLDLQPADPAFVGSFVSQNGRLCLRFLLSRIQLLR